MNSFILIATISILAVVCIVVLQNREDWSWTTFSGMPGPLESSCRSNIPSLYGNPKYESPCHYDFGKSNGPYIQNKQYPGYGS